MATSLVIRGSSSATRTSGWVDIRAPFVGRFVFIVSIPPAGRSRTTLQNRCARITTLSSGERQHNCRPRSICGCEAAPNRGAGHRDAIRRSLWPGKAAQERCAQPKEGSPRDRNRRSPRRGSELMAAAMRRPPVPPGNGPSSMRFSRRPAKATSRPCSRSSTPMSCCAATQPRSPLGAPPESAERMTSRRRSLAVHRAPSRLSSTAKPGLCGRREVSPRSSSPCTSTAM